MPKTTLISLQQVKSDFPQFTFKHHEVFHWSPRQNCVYYNADQLKKNSGFSQLLHELSHALLGHTHYGSGVELLKMETQAWAKAQELASRYDLEINAEQIETCLDSYRDWLYLRSSCPNCKSISAEVDSNTYHCFNCLQKWTVPKDQRSRSYRLKQIEA